MLTACTSTTLLTLAVLCSMSVNRWPLTPLAAELDPDVAAGLLLLPLLLQAATARAATSEAAATARPRQADVLRMVCGLRSVAIAPDRGRFVGEPHRFEGTASGWPGGAFGADWQLRVSPR